MAAAPSQHIRVEVDNRDWNQQVSRINIVIHTEGQWERSRLSNNHVTQYLSIPNGRSVQINERHVDEQDINGRFEMVSRNYRYNNSRSLITNFEFALSQPVTVRAIHDFIRSNSFNDFCFADGGMGCRHWHITLVALYEMNGWVAQFSGTRLLENLSFLYSRAAPATPTTIKPGSFDEGSTHRLARTAWTLMNGQMESSAQALSRQRQFVSSVLSNLTANPQVAMQQLQQLQAQGIVLRNPDAVRAHMAGIESHRAAAARKLSQIQGIMREFEELAVRRTEEIDSSSSDES